MELTQRLECTQEIFSNQSERICPEQIGFIGICGAKYPVKKGPNKIGRDPETCNIVINLNSISRQHAVLNVLNNNEYMLMDLDSANKTKLQDKTLQPYIPCPLRNGDTVQFGQVFGIFRLLEDETDLPMTQALDIPDTPISSRFVSKLNHVTTVPESPDVSDRDDSFIVPSQPKPGNAFKSPNTNFIKSSGKTISIQPIGLKKIDNVYWNSSKKSDSFHLHNNSSSINESLISVKSSDTSDINNIHEQETQVHNQLCTDGNNASFFDANTQIPDMDTEKPSSTNIYSMETQVPVTDKLNNIDIIIKENHINSSIDDKENDTSIFNAETQQFQSEFKTPSSNPNINKINVTSNVKEKTSKSSDDIILFDDIDSPPMEDNFESQAILPPSPIFPRQNCSNSSLHTSHEQKLYQEIVGNGNCKSKPLLSNSPTDCDDFALLPTQIIPKRTIEEQLDDDIEILQTQKIFEKVNDEDDVTDCEEEVELLKQNSKILKPEVDEDLTDCEDNLEDEKIHHGKDVNKPNFEDLDTQVLETDICSKNVVDNANTTKCNFEDMLTQIIPEENVHDESIPIINLEDMPTQLIETKVSTPKNKIIKDLATFKIPVMSPKKPKKKDGSKVDTPKKVPNSDKKVLSSTRMDDDDSNYYAATQELFDDLCTQKETLDIQEPAKQSTSDIQIMNHFESSEGEDKIEQFVSSLSSEQIRDVVGVENVTKLKKIPSDGSDVEVTPRKVKPLKFMEIDLPNSQEIKTSVTLQSKSLDTESSSDSETEKDSQQNTPIVFKPKRSISKEAKLDLSKKFDAENLPTRIMMRVRKPTDRYLNSNQTKDISKSILKSKIITDQEDNINTDIIYENISRLKSEKSKSWTGECSKTSKETKSGKKTEPKTTQIKVTSRRNSKEISKDIKIENKKQDKDNSDTIKEEKSEGIRKSQRTKKELIDSKTDIKESSVNKSNSESLIEPKSETRGRKKQNTQESVKKSSLPIEIEPLPEKRRKESSVNKSNSESLIEPKRETRGRKKQNTQESVKKFSLPIELEPLPEKRRRFNRHIEIIDSPEKQVRRSRRTRSKKEDTNKSKNSTTSSIKHEQSTVYNISSGSGADSPFRKRSASNEFLLPAKKGRMRPASALGISLRATPARKATTQYVLLTAFPSREVNKMLEDLGAVIVTDVKQCTVVLTIKIKRTFKLLCAVGLGKPIVGQQWLQACVDNKVIVDPWLYLIHDEAIEQRLQFNLQQSLVSKRNFLKGYNISSTPRALPCAIEMKLIVECSGGTYKEGGKNWVVVSTGVDREFWPDLVKRGAIVVSPEFILGGVLRQKLEVDRYKLA